MHVNISIRGEGHWMALVLADVEGTRSYVRPWEEATFPIRRRFPFSALQSQIGSDGFDSRFSFRIREIDPVQASLILFAHVDCRVPTPVSVCAMQIPGMGRGGEGDWGFPVLFVRPHHVHCLPGPFPTTPATLIPHPR